MDRYHYHFPPEHLLPIIILSVWISRLKMKILGNDIFISEIASWKLPSKNLQVNHLLIRNCRMTFLKAKNCRPISSEILRDCFPLFANLSGDVLVKKSVADRQRRAEIHRRAWLSRTHISPKIIVDFPFFFLILETLLKWTILPMAKLC